MGRGSPGSQSVHRTGQDLTLIQRRIAPVRQLTFLVGLQRGIAIHVPTGRSHLFSLDNRIPAPVAALQELKGDAGPLTGHFLVQHHIARGRAPAEAGVPFEGSGPHEEPARAGAPATG